MTNKYLNEVFKMHCIGLEIPSWTIGRSNMKEKVENCFKDPGELYFGINFNSHCASNYQEYVMSKGTANEGSIYINNFRTGEFMEAKTYLYNIMADQTKLLINTFQQNPEKLKTLLNALVEPNETTGQIMAAANHIEFINDLKELSGICHKICIDWMRADFDCDYYKKLWNNYNKAIIGIESCFQPIADSINTVLYQLTGKVFKSFSIHEMMKNIFKIHCYNPFSEKIIESFEILLKDVTQKIVGYYSKKVNLTRYIKKPE